MRMPAARLLLATLALALAAASCRPGREIPQIHGRVAPRAPVTLPEGAVLEVQVADVTRADAAPVVVAKRTYDRLGAAPWRFSLRADSLAALDPAHEYAVQARVLVDGKPRLVSKRRTLVDPAKLADTLDVVVEPVPRTVGARTGAPSGASAADAARAWNPPGGPVTLPAPISTLLQGPAGGPVTAPSRAAAA